MGARGCGVGCGCLVSALTAGALGKAHGEGEGLQVASVPIVMTIVGSVEQSRAVVFDLFDTLTTEDISTKLRSAKVSTRVKF